MIKFSLFITTLFIFNFSYSQVQTEKEIRNLLCHKWKLDSLEATGQRLPVPSGMEETFFDIKTDGILILGVSTNSQKGKWRYDHKTKTLIIEKESDDVLRFEFIKITQNELILQFTIQEDMSMSFVMKRVD